MITVERIQRETALHYGIGLERMLCENRRRDWARPRHVAMYLARRLTERRDRHGRRSYRYSFTTLARLFDRSDHTTVLHACKQVEKRLRTDPETQAHVGAILNRLFS